MTNHLSFRYLLANFLRIDIFSTEIKLQGPVFTKFF